MTCFFPRISVVCPTYNAAIFVERALLSVLSQTILPHELIISDDGSQDNTVDLISKLMKEKSPIPITVLKNPHRGAGAARNAGIRFSQGEWIAFLDSDDRWDPMKIERVAEVISKYPFVNFICHNETHIRYDGSRARLNYEGLYKPGIDLTRQLFRRNLFSTSAVTCKRSIFLQNGFFDETLISAQDYELWIRLSTNIIPHFIAEPLGEYFDRQGNLTSQGRERHLINVIRAISSNRSLVSRRTYFNAIGRNLLRYAKNSICFFLQKLQRQRD